VLAFSLDLTDEHLFDWSGAGGKRETRFEDENCRLVRGEGSYSGGKRVMGLDTYTISATRCVPCAHDVGRIVESQPPYLA
jgi:hypothetical protein